MLNWHAGGPDWRKKCSFLASVKMIRWSSGLRCRHTKKAPLSFTMHWRSLTASKYVQTPPHCIVAKATLNGYSLCEVQMKYLCGVINEIPRITYGPASGYKSMNKSNKRRQVSPWGSGQITVLFRDLILGVFPLRHAPVVRRACRIPSIQPFASTVVCAGVAYHICIRGETSVCELKDTGSKYTSTRVYARDVIPYAGVHRRVLMQQTNKEGSRFPNVTNEFVHDWLNSRKQGQLYK